MVYSQDPRIIRHLSEEADLLEQECLVEVQGQIIDDGLALLAQGLYVDGERLPPLKAAWQNETHLRFALKRVAPEWLPTICSALGLEPAVHEAFAHRPDFAEQAAPGAVALPARLRAVLTRSGAGRWPQAAAWQRSVIDLIADFCFAAWD